jgi:cobalamin synthase
MGPLSLLFALHGAIILFAGLVGGLFFARAIKRRTGEVAWRVVHAGGCAGGALLLAIAVPLQWVSLSSILTLALAWGFLLGTYLLVSGMFVAAIWNTRGISGGGTPLNRLVNGLYGAGAALSLAASALLIVGLLRAYCCAPALS